MRNLEIRPVLVLVAGFVALTSIACGLGLVTGVIEFPLAFLYGTPFRDYLVPGLLMTVVVGGSAFLAAVLLLAGHASGIFMLAFAGLILLGFEVAEVMGIDRNTGNMFPLVIALQAAYTVFSLIMLGGAAYLWRQTHHRQSTLGFLQDAGGERARATAEKPG